MFTYLLFISTVFAACCVPLCSNFFFVIALFRPLARLDRTTNKQDGLLSA